MADTDYALLPALKDRCNLSAGDTAPDTVLRGLLNVAARVVDAVTRHPPARWPYPAFSASPPLTRHYPDPYMAREPEPVLLDDLLTCTAVSRGGVVLSGDPSFSPSGPQYLLAPVDDLPKTALYLLWRVGLPAQTLLGVRTNLAVTGTWGFCAKADRPPEIAEATLLQAVIFYQRYGLDVEALANAQGDPLRAADKTVTRMLIGVTKDAPGVLGVEV